MRLTVAGRVVVEGDELLEHAAGKGDLLLVRRSVVTGHVDEERAGRGGHASRRVQGRVEQVVAHEAAWVVGGHHRDALLGGEARNEGVHGHRGPQGGAGGFVLGDALFARHEATLVGNAKIRLIVAAALDAKGVGAVKDAEMEEEKWPVGSLVLARTPLDVAVHGVSGRFQDLKLHVLGREARNGRLGERGGQGSDEVRRRVVWDAAELAKARHPDAGRPSHAVAFRASAESHLGTSRKARN